MCGNMYTRVQGSQRPEKELEHLFKEELKFSFTRKVKKSKYFSSYSRRISRSSKFDWSRTRLAVERREASRSTLVLSYVSCGTVFLFSILPLSQKTHHITEANENVSHLLNTAAGRGSDLGFTCYTAWEPHHSPALRTAGLFLLYRGKPGPRTRLKAKGLQHWASVFHPILQSSFWKFCLPQSSDLQESNGVEIM